MKHWRVKISRLEELVFSNTMLVDKESLYNVDDETFKREVYGITKENEDLQIESSRGSIITPLRPLKDKIRDKSKNKSPT